MRIYLIGFMGAGKTTVGKKLARALNLTFLDLDQQIERETGFTIHQLFEKGEMHFRRMESEVLKKTDAIENVVIATGGGAPCFFDNMDWMNKQGITVYIQMHNGSLYHRLSPEKQKRPRIAAMTDADLMEFISETMRYREPFYSKARVTVKGENLDAATIVAELEKHQLK